MYLNIFFFQFKIIGCSLLTQESYDEIGKLFGLFAYFSATLITGKGRHDWL